MFIFFKQISAVDWGNYWLLWYC